MGRLFLRQLLFIHGSWGRIVWLHLGLLFINGSWGRIVWLHLWLLFINAPGAGWGSSFFVRFSPSTLLGLDKAALLSSAPLPQRLLGLASVAPLSSSPLHQRLLGWIGQLFLLPLLSINAPWAG